MQATPLGPNLYSLEETVEGDLMVLLEDGGDWKNKWFKEVRKWKPSDVESYKAVWISVYGIPYHVRNVRLREELLSDIRSIAKFDFLEKKSERLDVLSFMVFTRSVESIRSKVNVCVVSYPQNLLDRFYVYLELTH